MKSPNNKTPHFIFAGTDDFAVTVLDTLRKRNLKPDLIITAPDKPAGRKLQLTPSPVKTWSTEYKLPLLQPASLKDWLPSGSQPDFLLTASYGLFLPKKLLQYPKKGCLNIHPSLLPLYRGPAPVVAAILSDNKYTGVSIMLMDQKMDHGPILAQAQTEINHKWLLPLSQELAEIGANLLADLLPQWLTDEIKPTPQNHALATFSQKISKQDGLINLADDPILNFKKIRAYTPWPGAYFFTKKDNLKITIKQAHLNENNLLVIDKIVPAGKQEMAWADWIRNRPEFTPL
ncbi:MAG: methionyl-tRNA formyltransferase [Patescibacteria group bacterium]